MLVKSSNDIKLPCVRYPFPIYTYIGFVNRENLRELRVQRKQAFIIEKGELGERTSKIRKERNLYVNINISVNINIRFQ